MHGYYEVGWELYHKMPNSTIVISVASGSLSQRLETLARFFEATGTLADKSTVIAWAPSSDGNATFQAIFNVACVIPRGVIAVNKGEYWHSYMNGPFPRRVFKKNVNQVTPQRILSSEGMIVIEEQAWFSHKAYDQQSVKQWAERARHCLRPDFKAGLEVEAEMQ